MRTCRCQCARPDQHVHSRTTRTRVVVNERALCAACQQTPTLCAPAQTHPTAPLLGTSTRPRTARPAPPTGASGTREHQTEPLAEKLAGMLTSTLVQSLGGRAPEALPADLLDLLGELREQSPDTWNACRRLLRALADAADQTDERAASLF